MIKFCSNCGKELKENADVCLNCGTLIKKIDNSQQFYSNSYNCDKQKIPGKGISIAGMVLGIVAIFWAVISLLSINNIYDALSHIYYVSEIIGFIIGYTLFSLCPSIVGLILSICGYRKQKSGLNVTGLILNIITLAIVVIEIVYIITLY